MIFLLVRNDSVSEVTTWWCAVSVYVFVTACISKGLIF